MKEFYLIKKIVKFYLKVCFFMSTYLVVVNFSISCMCYVNIIDNVKVYELRKKRGVAERDENVYVYDYGDFAQFEYDDNKTGEAKPSNNISER